LRQQFAEELVALNPDLLTSHGTPSTAALAKQIHTIPIIFVNVTDPVGSGFVESLSKPGGNFTGFTHYEPTLASKWLQLLKEIAPRVAKVAFFYNPTTAPYFDYYIAPFKAAAPQLGVEAIVTPVRDKAEFAPIIAALAQESNGGLIVMPDVFMTAHRKEIISLAARYHLPAVYPLPLFTAARPLLLTAIVTRLRSSELRGLRWSDVDLKKGELHVRQRADRYGVIGPPKSKFGYRTIPLGPTLLNVLREWKLACPNGKHDLVPTPDGGIALHNNVVRALKPAARAAGLTAAKGSPKYTGPHALRHFFASWCINPLDRGVQGLPPKVVQQQLGHSTIAMTMDTYGHLFPADEDAGKRLADAERVLLG